MDDIRIGRICRALRRRLGWRQSDVAAKVRCHQTTISRLERGHLGSLSVRLIKRIFAVLDARFEGTVSWRGADLDRLLDADHAELVEEAAADYVQRGWEVAPEVSYAVYGERGSIDLLAVHRDSRTAVVNEMKTVIGAVEETIRRHDVKSRLASDLVRKRFGFAPAMVVRVLVVREDRTNRRIVERHRRTFAAAYPRNSRGIARMLRRPQDHAHGIWFLSPKRPGHVRRPAGGRARVRVRRRAADDARDA